MSPLIGHTNEITSVVFSSDGQTFAKGSKDGTILLWRGILRTIWDDIKRMEVADKEMQSKERAPSAATSTPRNTALLSNAPNPFNPVTWIPYQSAHSAEVILTIYDMRGRLFGSWRWDISLPACIKAANEPRTGTDAISSARQ